MTAGYYDIEVEARAGYVIVFTYCNPGSEPGVPGPPIDISGWHGKMTVRSSYGDGAALTLDDQSLGGIAIGTTNGAVVVTMTAEQTQQLPSRGVYDIFLQPLTGDPLRLVHGSIRALQAVTVGT